MFVVFEGMDGGGKSTQLERLAKHLATYAKVVTCKDPGSTEVGEALRALLLKKSDMPIDIRTEMMLFSTARTQLVQEIVRPALADGAVVLLDRFVMSTIVYQGHAGKLPPEDIRRVNAVAAAGHRPDVTFVFDVPVEVAMQRIGSNQDRMESRGAAYFDAVRKGFHTEATAGPDAARCYLIDGTQPVEAIEQQIRETVDRIRLANENN